MTKKLYVGNLNYAMSEDELQTLFAEVGSVISAVIITDRMTGQSKGFGFVEMETEEAAQEAIQRLNDQEVKQRRIKVSEAHPRKQSFGDDKRRGRGRGDRGDSSRGYDRKRRY